MNASGTATAGWPRVAHRRRTTRVDVLDVPVDDIDMDGALAFAEDHIRHGSGVATILSVNPEKVLALHRDPQLMAFFRSSRLLIPDGIGVVMAMRLLHRLKTKRLVGTDLMHALCRVAPSQGHRIFIYGGREDVNRKSETLLRARYPDIDIVGRANGYLGPSEMAGLISAIEASGPDILFVALGSPRQELWMLEHLPRLNIKICQGIGGSLDTITGDVKRAPMIFQRLGLEWLYRLIKQPSRWRRQVVYPLFAYRVLRQAVASRRAR